MLFLQGFATVGVVQGREMLSVMNSEDGYFWANVAFGFASIFSGILYFIGAYWLLFFSTIKATLYDIPENYYDFHLKIRSADYHDFMDQYRVRLISFYTGLLLFGPFFIQLTAFVFADGMGLPLLFCLISTCLSNFLILNLKANRNSKTTQKIIRLFEKLDSTFLSGLLKIKKIYRQLVPRRKSHKSNEQYQILPLTTEKKVHSILQAHPMHRAIFLQFFLLSFCFWLVLLWLPENLIQKIGALACLQLALCFWVVIVVILEFVNKRVAFPVRLGLVAWLLFCSWFNADFPIRTVSSKIAFEKPQKPVAIFENWLKSRKDFQDSTSKGFIRVGGKTYCSDQPFPVWFLCAEGGASRSGYWTAAMLDYLRRREGEKFDRHLFAISSVSGGSMGSVVYSAGRTRFHSDSLASPLSSFFSTDFLAPLTNRLVACGPILWMSPKFFPFFDRATTFEKVINRALSEKIQIQQSPSFQDWRPVSGEFSPLLLLNSVEVETGKRAVLSNYPMSISPNFGVVSLNDLLENRALDLAGAIHISARFPVFSPAGAVSDKYCKTHHFVDGGYYDNVGYETANDLISEINKSRFANFFRPVVVALVNSYENAESIVESSQILPKEIQEVEYKPDFGQHFLNEPMSIVASVAHIRSANTERHWQDLLLKLELPKNKNQPASRFFRFDLKANQESIPLNWRISEQARRTLLERVQRVDQQLKRHPTFNKPISLGLENSCLHLTHSNKKGDLIFSDKSTSKLARGVESNSGISKVSPSTHPNLYYFSMKRKKWVLKSEADFPKNQFRRLSKSFLGKKKVK